MHRPLSLLLLSLSPLLPARAQTPKEVRALAKQGPNAIPQLTQYLNNSSNEVRFEAVKVLSEIPSGHILEPLIQATRDNDPSVQIRAVDGLVNFYVPGYLRTGRVAGLQRIGDQIKSRFVDNTGLVIDPFVTVRPEVITAIGKVVSGGSSMDSRANAAEAAGILRGKAALPDLLKALHSKDSALMYEALIALEKIGDQSAGPNIRFLIGDLDERVQSTAIEAVGLLQCRECLPDLRDVLKRTGKSRARRAALASIAMLPDRASRDLYIQYLDDKDEHLRVAAAEGLARLQDPGDMPRLNAAFQSETRTLPRLAIAFALVNDGNQDLSDLGVLRYLVNGLDSANYHDVASSYLMEATRNPILREKLYAPMEQGTRDEKIYLARVLARTGDATARPHIEKISHDADAQVADEGLKALRTLNARI